MEKKKIKKSGLTGGMLAFNKKLTFLKSEKEKISLSRRDKVFKEDQ